MDQDPRPQALGMDSSAEAVYAHFQESLDEQGLAGYIAGQDTGVTPDEAVAFLKGDFFRQKIHQHWDYESNRDRWQGRPFELAYQETVLHSLQHTAIPARQTVRFLSKGQDGEAKRYLEKHFPNLTIEEVKKIEQVSSLLSKYYQGRFFDWLCLC